MIRSYNSKRENLKLRKGLGIGDFAEEDVAGVVDAAFGVGVKHYFKSFMVESVRGCNLGNGGFVELVQPLRLRQALADEDGIEAFQIRQDDQLLQWHGHGQVRW